MSEREYIVYMMTNKRNTVIYTGVTNAVGQRTHDHKTKADPKSFTARYNVNKLVYVEAYDNIHDAIEREKQIKKGSRKKKEALINSQNPEWRDLSNDVVSF